MTINRPPRITRFGTLARGAALGAALLAALAACAGSPAQVRTAPSSPAAAAAALATRAHLGAGLSFTATYAVSGTATTVRVWVTPAVYRVEVSQGANTAALYGSAVGTAACPEQTGLPTVCYVVAGPGKAVPARFDAGIEHVFRRDLTALAAGARGFTVSEEQPAAAVTAVAPDARCFTVAPTPGLPALTEGLTGFVDPGTYCLSAAGLPVQLRFASGTLTLVSHGGAPQEVALRLPVPPQPLPASLAASPSAMPTLPKAFG